MRHMRSATGWKLPLRRRSTGLTWSSTWSPNTRPSQRAPSRFDGRLSALACYRRNSGTSISRLRESAGDRFSNVELLNRAGRQVGAMRITIDEHAKLVHIVKGAATLTLALPPTL